MKIQPKIENTNKGFYYTVSDEQIAAHQRKTVEEICLWIENTYKFIYAAQTPEERMQMHLVKNMDNNFNTRNEK